MCQTYLQAHGSLLASAHENAMRLADASRTRLGPGTPEVTKQHKTRSSTSPTFPPSQRSIALPIHSFRLLSRSPLLLVCNTVLVVYQIEETTFSNDSDVREYFEFVRHWFDDTRFPPRSILVSPYKAAKSDIISDEKT